MIGALFIILAAISKALADTLWHHFDTSVFKKKNPKFWNPQVSWQHAPFVKYTKYRWDAWHLANSAMIVFFCAGIVAHKQITWWWIELIVAGTLFILVFNLFYNKAFLSLT